MAKNAAPAISNRKHARASKLPKHTGEHSDGAESPSPAARSGPRSMPHFLNSAPNHVGHIGSTHPTLEIALLKAGPQPCAQGWEAHHRIASLDNGMDTGAQQLLAGVADQHAVVQVCLCQSVSTGSCGFVVFLWAGQRRDPGAGCRNTHRDACSAGADMPRDECILSCCGWHQRGSQREAVRKMQGLAYWEDCVIQQGKITVCREHIRKAKREIDAYLYFPCAGCLRDKPIAAGRTPESPGGCCTGAGVLRAYALAAWGPTEIDWMVHWRCAGTSSSGASTV